MPNPDSKPLPADLALLLTTSGSTGSPKLVRLSQKNLRSNADSIISYLNITEDERPVTGLPMYYSFGLSIINSHLLKGATLLLTNDSYIKKEFWTFANQYGFTSFSGVPFTFELLNKIKFWSMQLPTLKTITQAGGKLNNELIQLFYEEGKKKGIEFITMYGQTEATARMSYLPVKFLETKLGSIGKGIPGGTLFLVDDDKQMIMHPNVIGELVYKGDNVCLGYAESLDDLYRGDDNKGVLYTGDLAYFDEDGFFYIAGRKKRFLKLYGNRISLDYVEQLLTPYLKEKVCIGKNDEKLIILTTDAKYDEKQIIDFLSEKTNIIRTALKWLKSNLFPGQTLVKFYINNY